ncbi:unnamed protein product [Cochlearia groenlandica]
MDNNNQQSFWKFSDQLRVETPHNLSLNESSIWSTNNNSVFKRNNDLDRRNFDITADKTPLHFLNNKTCNDLGGYGPVGSKSYTNKVNDTWKFNNGDFNKGVYSSSPLPVTKNYGNNMKNKGIMDEVDQLMIPKGLIVGGKKNRKNQNHNHQRNHNNNKNNNNNNNEDDKNNGLDKRFKTLPPAEALPRNETIGGYIFVCNNETMEENLKRQLFGLPPRYRDSVRAITPGLPLFLYNYSTHQLHGIYQASSFGGTNIEVNAFEDKKCGGGGESRFPAQVRAITRKVCLPLEEDSFRPILHHYDGPKFRLELTVPEVLSLLDIFYDQNP